MYNIQSNSARFIYTLSATKPDSKYTLKKLPIEIINTHINSIVNDPQSKRIHLQRNHDDTTDVAVAVASISTNDANTIIVEHNSDNCGLMTGIVDGDATTFTTNNTTIINDKDANDDDNNDNNTLSLTSKTKKQKTIPQSRQMAATSYSSLSVVSQLTTIQTNSLHQPYCKLKNGFYLTKVARSDEKIRYTETDMYALVRTVLFIYCYGITPLESLTQIINSGDITYDYEQFPNQLRQTLTIGIAIELLDMLFGDGFSTVVGRMVIKCMQEYNCIWRHYPYISKVVCPSALDFIKLARFVNTSTFEYSKSTQFMLNNTCDHRIPLQNTIKRLR